jgi:hypothetical protein
LETESIRLSSNPDDSGIFLLLRQCDSTVPIIFKRKETMAKDITRFSLTVQFRLRFSRSGSSYSQQEHCFTTSTSLDVLSCMVGIRYFHSVCSAMDLRFRHFSLSPAQCRSSSTLHAQVSQIINNTRSPLLFSFSHRLWGRLIFLMAVFSIISGLSEYGAGRLFFVSNDAMRGARLMMILYGIFITIGAFITISLLEIAEYQRPAEENSIN